MGMAIVLAAGLSAPALGEVPGNNVRITLSSFKVTLNGTKVNNDYSKYPLIVYKNKIGRASCRERV